jgi:hypothetical protein
MDTKQVAKNTAKAVQNYLTFQAVQIAIDQLTETNPGMAIWLRQYSAGNTFQAGELYLENLMRENKELALRVMTVREHLAETVLEFLPDRVKSDIHQANIEHRRQLLERMTQIAQVAEPPAIAPTDPPESELDSDNPPD